MSDTKTFVGRVYQGRDDTGRELYSWVGRFTDPDERDRAVEQRKADLEVEAVVEALPRGDRILCDEYAAEYLDRMVSGALTLKSGRRFKLSTIDTARSQLKRFVKDFEGRPLSSVDRYEATRWAERHGNKQCNLQSVVTLFALAVSEDVLGKNPFRELMRKPGGAREHGTPDGGTNGVAVGGV
jgi:hypothetical protein